MSVPPEQPPVYPPPGTPVEQPTAPLDPVVARQGAGPYRTEPAYVADPRPAAWRLEGLRTAVTIVGLIALIAIGLAVWALIRANHNRTVATGTTGSTAALTALNRRVNNLEATVSSLKSVGGNHVANARSLTAQIAALQQTQKQLSSQVKQLSSQSSHSGSTAQVTQLAGKEASLSGKVSQITGKEASLSGKVSQITGKEASLSGQVSQLQGKVAQLKEQVAQLQGQTGGQTTATGTGTDTSTIP